VDYGEGSAWLPLLPVVRPGVAYPFGYRRSYTTFDYVRVEAPDTVSDLDRTDHIGGAELRPAAGSGSRAGVSPPSLAVVAPSGP
jgi:hypothetical protein